MQTLESSKLSFDVMCTAANDIFRGYMVLTSILSHCQCGTEDTCAQSVWMVAPTTFAMRAVTAECITIG